MKIHIVSRVDNDSDLRTVEKEYKKLLATAEKLAEWKKAFERCHQEVNISVKKVEICFDDDAEVLAE